MKFFILGIIVALISGVVIGPVTTMLGVAIFGDSRALPFLISLLPAIVYLLLWLLLRRRVPNFAKGIAVGASIVVLLCGICNWAIYSPSVQSGFTP